MFNSEIIVGLWFVPVVLSILIPLSMLCVWGCVDLLRKINARFGRVEESAKDVLHGSYAAPLRPRYAV